MMLCPTADRLLSTWTENDREAFYRKRLRVHGDQTKAHCEWQHKIQRMRHIPAKVREAVLDWGECRYCGGRATVIDHYIPITRGGYSTQANLMPACGLCNQDKADLYMDEWQARREMLGRPWPTPNTREIRARLLISVRAELEPLIREGQMAPELSDEFMEVIWHFEKQIYNGADLWDEAPAALRRHLAEETGVHPKQRVDLHV
jgi:5-methylcytosine-specific restriction endonuclease McrA